MDGLGLALHQEGGGLSPRRAREEWGHLWLGGERPWGHDLQYYRNLDITKQESAEGNNVAGPVVQVSLSSGQKPAAARAGHIGQSAWSRCATAAGCALDGCAVGPGSAEAWLALPPGANARARRTDKPGSSCAVSEPVAPRPPGPVRERWRS
jgi:hypothetical protein